MADDCAHATLGASQECCENRKGDAASASRRGHRGRADQQQRQAQQPGGRSARGKGANGLVGRAPSWAEAGWHPMAVMVASGQLRNGGTGVYIPGAARPRSFTAPGGGSEGSSPHALSASPEAPSAPASPPSGSPPRAVGVLSTGSNVSGAGAVRAMSQEWGAPTMISHDENLVGSFPPLERGPRGSMDAPRPPPPRYGLGAAPALPSPPNAGERAAHAAAAAAAAVDAAAQALAAAQAAAAAAASEPAPAAANGAETLALQVALLQLQQQQVQLQQLQQQQGLQQLQQEALLQQFLVTTGPQLQATAQPHPPMLSGDSVWSNASFFPATDAPFSSPTGPAHGGSALSSVHCSPSTFDTATFCSGLPSPAFSCTASHLSGPAAPHNTQVLSTGDEPVLLGAFNLRRSPGYW